MAKLQSSIFGAISGRIGQLVFFTRNGKTYVKSRPRPSSKPATEIQIIQRAKFGMVQRFLSPVSTLLNESYKKINRKKAGSSVAVKQILQEAITGEYPNLGIDYSKVRLVRGNLPAPLCIMMRSDGFDNLSFRWLECRQFGANPDDELLVLVYCSSLSEFWCDLNPGSRRSDGFCKIGIPAAFSGHKLQVWLAYRSQDRRSFSNSEYAGEILNNLAEKV